MKTIEELAETRPDLTIVFITQRIEDIASVFNRGMILKSGEIVAHGSWDEVLTEENPERRLWAGYPVNQDGEGASLDRYPIIFHEAVQDNGAEAGAGVPGPPGAYRHGIHDTVRQMEGWRPHPAEAELARTFPSATTPSAKPFSP